MKWMRHLAFSLLLLAVAPVASASGPVYQANHQYLKLFPTQPVTTGARIEVREFFWYGCPHCFHLEEPLSRWLAHLPPGVAFVRTPAALRSSWAPQARAYYAFKALGVLSREHQAFFNAIHVKHEPLWNESAIVAWAAHRGLDAARFKAAYESFSTSIHIKNDNDLARLEGIDSVPTIVVDGRYLTNPAMAGSREKMLRVVDFLIAKARAHRARMRARP